jgi:hypothetical protein
VTELSEIFLLWLLARATRGVGSAVPLLDPSSEPFPPAT